MTDVDDKKAILDEKFMELKKLLEEKKKIRTSLRELFDKSNTFRDKKKKIVEFIKKTKQERGKVQDKLKEKSGALKDVIKKKQEFSDIGDFRQLSKQIKGIEWKIWTEVLPYK